MDDWAQHYVPSRDPQSLAAPLHPLLHSQQKRGRNHGSLCALTWATSLSHLHQLLSGKRAEPTLCSTFNHNLCIMHTLHRIKPLWMHTQLLHPLCEGRHRDTQRLASKFTTSSIVQRKATPLLQWQHFVTPSVDEWATTFMRFVWNSGMCISFFSFLPNHLSFQLIWTLREIF